MTKQEFNQTQNFFTITNCVKEKNVYKITWITRGFMGESKRWFDGKTSGEAIENAYEQLIENARHYKP